MEAVSVSALTKYLQAKFTRDIHLQHVKLKGELSNVKFHNKGHLYFTLKDEYARISGIAFANTLTQLKIQPEDLEDGMEVEIEGSVRVYETTGTYQIYTTSLSASGVGFLQKQYNVLFEQYKQSGYFSDEHKIEVPKRIHSLGIITAEDGAAIEDMKKSILSHIPHIAITLFPTLVQGDEAPSSIAKAIQKADKKNIDVLIVGRGGGSLEDLWAFNTASVIEAIYAAKTPIISAVGHEIDTMLSDYTADLRVPTPTAAIYYFASTVSIQADIKQRLESGKQCVQKQIDFQKQTLQLAIQQLRELDPRYQIESKQQALKIEFMRLSAVTPSTLIDTCFINLAQMKQRLKQGVQKSLEQTSSNLKVSTNVLKLLNPEAQLERGYALVYDDENIVTTVSNIKSDLLTVQLSDGKIDVKVVEINGKGKRKSTDL